MKEIDRKILKSVEILWIIFGIMFCIGKMIVFFIKDIKIMFCDVLDLGVLVGIFVFVLGV